MWQCPNKHEIEVVVASLPSAEDPNNEMEVLVDAKTGNATNRFFDGIVGVPAEIAELAEADESPRCPECMEECDWVLTQIGVVRSGSEYYQVFENGMLGRKGLVQPSGQWALTGAVRFTNFGHVTERMSLADVLAGKIKDWQYKNGKQKWHLCDLDHGSSRTWMSPRHELMLD